MGKSKLTNEEVLKKGLQKAQAIIIRHIVDQLRPVCVDLLESADMHRTFFGFTGNTQTSYMCMIYISRQCREIITRLPHGLSDPPRQFIEQQKYDEVPKGKVPYGEWVYLREPYEYVGRSVFGKVPVNNLSGAETSKEFLKNFQPSADIAIVMTTGTEYSVFLEEFHHYDVLSGAHYSAPKILENRLFKPLSASEIK